MIVSAFWLTHATELAGMAEAEFGDRCFLCLSVHLSRRAADGPNQDTLARKLGQVGVVAIPTTFVPKETQPRPGGALFENEPRRASLAREIMGMDRWRHFQNRI